MKGAAMKQRSLVRAVASVLRALALGELAVLAAAALLFFIQGWRSADDYGLAVMIVGAAVGCLGIMSGMGNQKLGRSPRVIMNDLARTEPVSEQLSQWRQLNRDSFGFVVQTSLIGLLSFAISYAIQLFL